MLSNVPGNVFIFLLAATSLIIAALIVGFIIFAIIKATKGKAGYIKWGLFAICSITIVALSWILNFGWIRFFCTLLVIPIIHAIIYFLTTVFSVKYFEKIHNIKFLNSLFTVSYLVSYIFFPDGGDIGTTYFFFGLVHSDILSSIASMVSCAGFIANLVLFIMITTEISNAKKTKNFKFISNDSLKYIELHDCECSSVHSKDNLLIFEMNWLEVLTEHPMNPHESAHSTGVGRIILQSPKIDSCEIKKSDNTILNIHEIDKLDFTDLIVLTFEENAKERRFISNMTMLFKNSEEFDSISLKVSYDKSYVMWNDFKDIS